MNFLLQFFSTLLIILQSYLEEIAIYGMAVYYDSDLKLITLDDSESARCLDGSPAAYYFGEGKGENANNYILYFLGGGFCQGDTEDEFLEQCRQRSYTILGSSQYMPSRFYYGTILSNKQEENPFYDWNRIFIMYCDGAIHQGSLSQPKEINGRKLYFRGQDNVNEILSHALQNRGLNSAGKVLVSGQSAGGIATYIWADHIKKIVPQNALYAAVPDSGFFLEYPRHDSQHFKIRDQMKLMMNVTNVETLVPHQQCSQHYSTLEENWKCLYAQYLAEFIQVPMFVINSEYDSWSIPNIQGIDCVQLSLFDKSVLNLNNCNSTQIQEIEQYRSMIMSNITNILQQNQQWGAWLSACVNHVYTRLGFYNTEQYEVPMESGNTVAKSIFDWYNFVTSQQRTSDEFRFIDNDTWPSNKPCSFAAK